MSKLSNAQIAAQMNSLETRIRWDAARGDAAAVRRRTKKLDEYREELAARQARGAAPAASEIQEARRVK